ncbi:MAG: glucose-6-phosphate isomerase, partial [Agrobacterium vaccinii]
MQAIVETLKSTAAKTAATDLRAAFAADANRFEQFSVRFDDLLMDYSKCAVNDEVQALLEKLAIEGGVEKKRDEMFSGAEINFTEGRAVLHTALRNRPNTPVMVDGKDVMPDVNGVLAAMGKFADAIRSGALKGATGKKITDVVNIGIGGSDLGPVMATLSLAPFHDGPRAHFVSNIDGAHIADTLKLTDPETTLFIVASKTFTTIETMTNAATARKFIADALGEDAVKHHFCAVS